MSIKDCVKIDTVYTRSINFERDCNSEAIVNAYIPTTRALLTLNRLHKAMHFDNAQRAWALIGPYGSGKSSFAVFLSHLLGEPNNKITNAAFKVLNSADSDLSNGISENTTNSRGFLPVLLTGSPEPFAKRFLHCLLDSALKYWKNQRGPSPSIINKLKKAVNSENTTHEEILEFLKELQATVAKGNGKGIVLIFDELGKFLEYEIRHPEVNDIFLLQSIAELAGKGNKANLFVFTLMHQGFEQYAKGAMSNLRSEWAKIQGRFENIPFLESAEQTLRVMSKAFISTFDKQQKSEISSLCIKYVDVLESVNSLPGTLNRESATDLFRKCYPLHPLTALILPLLCQKMAQNERTLFSYLGSKEPHGFSDSIETLKSVKEWIEPGNIYDYFILNQPAVLTDPATNRRWAEVVTSIERLGDAPFEQVQLLKIIGLLNIIGAHGGLKASKEIISLCFSKEQEFKTSVDALEKASVIQYRKFSGEYRVWQGSDFDIEQAISDEIDQMGIFCLADEINKRNLLQPIVARRYTIKSGTLRYFHPTFVDVQNFLELPKQSSTQRIILCLTETVEDVEIFHKKIKSYFSDLDVVVMCPNGYRLRSIIGEAIALGNIEINRQELNSDPVALREFKDRYNSVEQSEDELLSAYLDKPEENQWYWKNEELKINSKRELQQRLSSILEKIYYLSPIINNELINRQKPSTQAITARNKLIVALSHHEEEEDLGIDKFPAEKGIYRSLFKATGLHREIDGVWKIQPPYFNNPEKDPFNIGPVWKRMNDFLISTENCPKSFSELDKEFQAPPYGVKAGLLPLLYFTIYFCNRNEIALYENGVYTPYVTDRHIERFLKRQDVFTVQCFKVSGIRTTIFKQYVNALYGDKQTEGTLLSIARPLAKFIANLEDYTKKTNRLSDRAQKVRKSFDISKDPVELLFKKLPEACGFHSINPDETNEKRIDGFAAVLVDVIRELRETYNNMLFDMQKLLLKTLLPDVKKEIKLSDLRIKLCAKYEGLYEHTADSKGLRPFIEILSSEDCDDKTWLNRLLLFLGKKSPKIWTDTDRDGATLFLNELSKRLFDLELLHTHYLRKRSCSEEYSIILLRAMKHGHNDNDEVVKIDSEQKKYISGTKEGINKLLTHLKDEESKLAVIAEIVDELLSQKNRTKNTEKQLGVVNE